MCIAAWAWQCHPTHRLLLLFNRDEYHSRPTQPAQWWAPGEDAREILGGRDELGGGTWMGCTRDGKLAFLTNVREPSSLIGAKTRGQLPVRFLQGSVGPLEYATEIAKEADQYNGFNLILADVNSGTMVYISNRPGGDPVIQTVAPGIHVLSNAAIDTPWPKAMHLGQSFKRYLAIHDDSEASLKEMVEELMMDTARPDRSMVPDTGVDPEWEYKLSSIFIDTAKEQARYGTRSMVALAAKLDSEVTFYDREVLGEQFVEGESHTVPDGEGTLGREGNFRTPAKSGRLLIFWHQFIFKVYIIRHIQEQRTSGIMWLLLMTLAVV